MNLDWEGMKGEFAKVLAKKGFYEKVPSRYSGPAGAPGVDELWCWREVGEAFTSITTEQAVEVLEETFKDYPELQAQMAGLVASALRQQGRTVKGIKTEYKREVKKNGTENAIDTVKMALRFMKVTN